MNIREVHEHVNERGNRLVDAYITTVLAAHNAYQEAVRKGFKDPSHVRSDVDVRQSYDDFKKARKSLQIAVNEVIGKSLKDFSVVEIMRIFRS